MLLVRLKAKLVAVGPQSRREEGVFSSYFLLQHVIFAQQTVKTSGHAQILYTGSLSCMEPYEVVL